METMKNSAGEMKPVQTWETFSFSTAKPGDLVVQEIVDYAMDCLPPVCLRDCCKQMGEPHSIRQDPDTGKWRTTFATFKKIAGNWIEGNEVYEYCGNCFCGENMERGKDPVYC
jgi:hypothetical protein